MKAILRDLTPLLLLISWPFVAFLANNRDQLLQLEDVLVPWLIVAVLAIALALLIARGISGHPTGRVAITLGFLGVVFFSFGALADLMILLGVRLGTVWLATWLVVFLVVGAIAWFLSRRPAAHSFATVVALALIAWPALQLVMDGVATVESHDAGSQTDTAAQQRPAAESRPNVYWFLLDGYIRDDALARYFDYDNEPFLSSLSGQGFRIGTSSFANYDNTMLSLTSTLTSEYRQLPDGEAPDADEQVSILSGFNPVVSRFISLGYRYIHAPYAGAAKTQCGGQEDRCIRARPSGSIPLNSVQVSLLQLTPLFRVLRQLVDGAFRYDHIFVEDVMSGLGTAQPEPFFLFAHILSPHAPPRYSADCKRLNGIGERIDVGEDTYDPAQFRIDTKCTSQSVGRAIRDIIASDPTDPIIILQGDHGFKFRLPGEPSAGPEAATTGEGLFRRLAILNAMRLPNECRDTFTSSLTPINTFPLVFACIEGRPPNLKPDRHFIRPTGSEGGIVEVRPGLPE